MSIQDHPGLSEEDMKAAEVLKVLKKSNRDYQTELFTKEEASSKRSRSSSGANSSNSSCSDNANEETENNDPSSNNLLNRMVNNVVTFYDDFNDRKRVGSIAKLLDDAYEDNYSSSEDDDDEYYTREGRVSKRQKISEAIAKSKDNFKEYKLNMSIESKKSLITCLHLLKLANKQLSDKVTYLQEMVNEEQELPEPVRKRRRTNSNIHNGSKHHHHHNSHKYTKADSKSTSGKDEKTDTELKNSSSEKDSDKSSESASCTEDEYSDAKDEEDEEEEFFDAFDSNNFDEKSTVIKMEVVGTIKKVYSLISRYTGDSLPEPARSQVRESLLNLPTNWILSANETSMSYSAFTTAPRSISINSEVSTTENSTTTTTTSETKKDDNDSSDKTNKSEITKPTRTIPTTNENGTDLTPNGKILILAKESLDMVQNVMDVVDSTLGKAEEWVKQKQEVKEMFLRSLLSKQTIREEDTTAEE